MAEITTLLLALGKGVWYLIIIPFGVFATWVGKRYITGNEQKFKDVHESIDKRDEKLDKFLEDLKGELDDKQKDTQELVKEHQQKMQEHHDRLFKLENDYVSKDRLNATLKEVKNDIDKGFKELRGQILDLIKEK